MSSGRITGIKRHLNEHYMLSVFYEKTGHAYLSGPSHHSGGLELPVECAPQAVVCIRPRDSVRIVYWRGGIIYAE